MLRKHEEWIVRFLLIAILLLGAGLFFVGYDYEMPVLELDEGALLGVTFAQRGISDALIIPGYPPIIIGTLHLSQAIVEWYTNESAIFHSTEVIVLLRLFNIIINLVTLCFVYLFASQLGNRVSGLIAAFAFAIMPEVFEHIRLALTESWQLLFISMSAYAMMRTLQQKKMSWAILCTIAGLLAVCAKYNNFPILGLGVGSVLWLIWQDDKKWWRVLAIQVFLITVTALLVWYVFDARTLLSASRPETNQLNSVGFSRLFELSFVWGLFRESFAGISFPSLRFLALLILGTSVYFWVSKSEQKVAWFFLIIFVITVVWFVASYIVYSSTRDRYVMPSSTVLIALASVSITSIGQFVINRSKQFWVGAVVIAALSIFWLGSASLERLQVLDTLSRQNTLAGLSQWTETSLPEGTIALDNNNWKVFDPLYGGYTRAQRTWVNRDDWLNRSLDEWIENYVFYVQYSGAYPGEIPDFMFEQDELLYLKSFPVPDEEDLWSGPALHIYRMWDMEHETSVVFGENIILRGYDLSSNSLSVGDSLTWSPYWSSNEQPDAIYQVFLHLVPMDNFEVLAQADGTPALANRPTITWNDSNETIIGNSFTLSIPENIEDGEYRLIAGLYQLTSFARLTTSEGLDYFVIDTVLIES